MLIVDLIQAMLAPGLMISACGLLVLGINNKYSLVINRVRLLEAERRKLVSESVDDSSRFTSINIQIDKLQKRLKKIRNTVVAYSMAIALFILVCLTIGIHVVLDEIVISYLSLIFFLLGMTCVLLGVVFAVQEAIQGYMIVEIELTDD